MTEQTDPTDLGTWRKTLRQVLKPMARKERVYFLATLPEMLEGAIRGEGERWFLPLDLVTSSTDALGQYQEVRRYLVGVMHLLPGWHSGDQSRCRDLLDTLRETAEADLTP